MIKSKCNCHKIDVSTLEISIFFQQKSNKQYLSSWLYAIEISIFPTISSVFSQQWDIKSTILNIPKTATNEGLWWILIVLNEILYALVYFKMNMPINKVTRV